MDRNFFVGMIIGVSVGAVVGLIYAPRPGMEIRQDIAGRSRRAAHRLSDFAHIIAETASGVEEKIKQAI